MKQEPGHDRRPQLLLMVSVEVLEVEQGTSVQLDEEFTTRHSWTPAAWGFYVEKVWVNYGKCYVYSYFLAFGSLIP